MMSDMERNEPTPKSTWESPSFERVDVSKTELGLLTGGDLIILGTAS